MANILNQEVAVISHIKTFIKEESSNINLLVVEYLNGEYENILKSETAEKLLRENPKDTEDLVLLIKNNVENLLHSENTDLHTAELEILLVGVASLQLFVQNNWLGPLTSSLPTEFIHQRCRDTVNKRGLSDLSVDGEAVYNLTRYLPYLYIANIILLESRDFLSHLHTSKWWLLRCLYIQQEVLDDRAPTLRSTVLELIESIVKQEPLFTHDQYTNQVIEFHLEAGHLCHIYYEYKQGQDHFNQAKKLSGLEMHLTGAMGKRTRYQQDEKAQLALEIKRSKEKVGLEPDENVSLPKVMQLDDDTVLNQINFTDKDHLFAPQLTPLEQSIVIGCMEAYRRSLASERLTDEEILTYLSCILSQLCNWNVGVVGLKLRSKLERDSRRRVERSMMQLEELVNQISRSESSNIDRIQLFYANRVPSIWNLKKELGYLLLSLGCTSQAKDLYESLEMWDEAIPCYQRMGKLDQVEVIIREQLAKQETPNLYCFLGDVTNDVQWYQKAWELSNHRSARSMRCMGFLYFTKQDYETALDCFEKSLEINPLQIPVWFTYGCIALTTHKYEKAVKGFKRCVMIDSDNFEAWNNLGTAYIKLKQKSKAFLTMKEAIKYNYESWQLWDNMMVIGTDCGEFQDVILAYNRLMDIKDKWVDVEVLKVLVRCIEDDLDDKKGQPCKRLQPKVQELFGRITAKTTGNGDIWRLYARLILLNNKPENIEKGLQYLQKSHRCVVQTSNWEKDEKTCTETTEQSTELAKLYITCSENITDKTLKLQNLSSAKLMIKGVVTKMRQHHTDPVNQTLPSSIEELCKGLDNLLQDIINKIDVLRNG
ncbi:tetratricopeptide repeat protein 27 isoform X1 [Patella vulgata]|uniref:tetratricopeptide repeat protein 27 isoform X1 n=2 Tax=Patella vulgata TaxID=6465 RepID=UPI00217F9D1A|nr:tetratricopeptide repeat protein 27 isoform X1 [Patella vulgata]